MKRYVKPVAVACGALLFLGFVWPTPYEYSQKKGKLFRTSRFGGKMEAFDGFSVPGFIEGIKGNVEQYQQEAATQQTKKADASSAWYSPTVGGSNDR